MFPSGDFLPRSVEEAVHVLETKWLSAKDREFILGNPKDHVVATLHFGFGTGVRNAFGLWGSRNPELLASCGVRHPEDCSGVIIRRLWESVRSKADPMLLRNLDCQFLRAKEIKIDSKNFHKLRLGKTLQTLQKQIDDQSAEGTAKPQSDCGARLLQLTPIGPPDFGCRVDAGFTKNDAPVSLDLMLARLAVRNRFYVVHSPPTIELRFLEKCAFPERRAELPPRVCMDLNCLAPLHGR